MRFNTFIGPVLVVVIGCLGSGGCADREQIPRYPLMGIAASNDLIRERAASLASGTGKGTVTLTDKNGRSVTLDAVYVLEFPDNVRLRGWKFGQAVFDLTVTGDEIWLYAPREENRSQMLEGAERMGDSMKQFIRLARGDLAGETKESGRYLEVTQALPHGAEMTSRVDRDTLTLRSCVLTDENAIVRLRLSMSRYAVAGPAGEHLWPGKVAAVSERGTIVVETSRFQPNVLARGAFVPPARAVRVR